jgi:hypothetical protein
MTEPELSSAERSLLKVLPLDGSGIGNKRAREILGWSDKRYWATRNALEDKGLVLRGPGKGGSTRRNLPEPTVEIVAVPVEPNGTIDIGAIASLIRREEDLYADLAAVIRTSWAEERREKLLSVEIIARQGGFDIG